MPLHVVYVIRDQVVQEEVVVYVSTDRDTSRKLREERALNHWRGLQQLLQVTCAKYRPEVVVDELYSETWHQQHLLDSQSLTELEYGLLGSGGAVIGLPVEVAVNAGVGQPVVDISASDRRHSPLASRHSVNSSQLTQLAVSPSQLQSADLLTGAGHSPGCGPQSRDGQCQETGRQLVNVEHSPFVVSERGAMEAYKAEILS